MSRNSRNHILAWVAVSLTCGVISCSGDVGKGLRRHTYPPDFRYFTKTELQNTMWKLASLVSELDELTARLEREPAEATDESRDRADTLLGEMAQASRALGPGGWPSNHPVIGPNVEKFRLDVAAARRALSFDPPNFTLAESISDACFHCHGRRIN